MEAGRVAILFSSPTLRGVRHLLDSYRKMQPVFTDSGGNRNRRDKTQS